MLRDLFHSHQWMCKLKPANQNQLPLMSSFQNSYIIYSQGTFFHYSDQTSAIKNIVQIDLLQIKTGTEDGNFFS